MNAATPISPTPAAAVEYVKAGLVLVPFDRGTKGPRRKGWNLPENCISTVEKASNLFGNIGLAHAYSRTCCIDIDDMSLGIPWFAGVGIDLPALWNAPNATRWTSGLDNRGKLGYRLPKGIALLPTRMFTGEGIELRCATAQGLTVQDVLPPSLHPKTGQPYRWIGPRDFRNIPEIPADLLALWQSLAAPRTAMPGGTAPIGLDHADIQARLDRYDPATLDYDGWLHIGMALHHETGGASSGQQMWERWSFDDGKNNKHNEDRANFDGRYASFHLDHENPVTLRSLDKLAAPVDMRPEYEVLPPLPAPTGVLRGAAASCVGKAALSGPWSEPPVIVDGYMLQNSGSLFAPGGLAKTTLGEFEAIHIITGRSLYGRRIVKPGRALFITAEDSKEVLISRANRICATLGLTDAEYECVGDGLLIEDLSEVNARLLGSVQGVIRTTKVAAEIMEKYADQNISYLHLDPVSLLGPGELSGNDGMAEVHRLGRRFSRALRCAVRWIHHTGQSVARQGIQDQYAGRGGTAFADNARFVHQLDYARERRFTFDEIKYAIPPSVSDFDIKSGNVLMIMVHKISYQARNKAPILLLRDGFRFTHIALGFDTPESAAAQGNCVVESICGLLDRNLANGVKLNATDLDNFADDLNLKRAALRKGLVIALATGRIVETELPPAQRKGRRQTYLQPIDVTDEGL